MKRRNQTLTAMVEKANKFFANSADEMKEERKTLANFVEIMLMEANSYKGFNYIYWLEEGFKKWKDAGMPEGKEKDQYIYGPSMDQTRVRYY